MRFAERLFRIMDENEDGELTIEEFVKGFHKLKVKGNCYGNVTVTAYITERTLTEEDWEPKPAIALRRKSLRRGSNLKLFNTDGITNPAAESAEAAAINAISAAAAAKVANKIAAKIKMRIKEDGTKEYFCPDDNGDPEINDQLAAINAAAAAAAAKAANKIAAKIKMRKREDGTIEYFCPDGDDDPAIKAAIDAASAGAAAKAANKIAARIKMRKNDDGTEDFYCDDENEDDVLAIIPVEDDNGMDLSVAATFASKAANAKTKVRKKEAIRRVRKVWKIKQIW